MQKQSCRSAVQLLTRSTADLRLCFCFTDSTSPLLFKSEISTFWPSSETVQAGLSWTLSENPEDRFPMLCLKSDPNNRQFHVEICRQNAGN